MSHHRGCDITPLGLGTTSPLPIVQDRFAHVNTKSLDNVGDVHVGNDDLDAGTEDQGMMKECGSNETEGNHASDTLDGNQWPVVVAYTEQALKWI